MTQLPAPLSGLSNVRTTANGWQANCPGHDDSHASLSISVGSEGRILTHCHGGCTPEVVAEAGGWILSDLQPSPNGNKKWGKPVRSYDYHDVDGKVIFQVVRCENPKGFFQQRPNGKGGWIKGMTGVTRVPYRLPDLLQAQSKLVIIAEGEKDCDRLAGMEFVATCNAGGVAKWRPEYNAHFHGRLVAILPDNDDVGYKHAQVIASALHGVAAGVKVVELPDLPPKGDVSDWLDNGGTSDELRAIIKAAKVWRPTVKVLAGEQTPIAFHLTDTGLAERFTQQHAENVHFSYPWSKWLVWNDACWKVDDTGRLRGFAKQTARSILKEAAMEPDKKHRKELAGFALRSESAVRLNAMLSLAQSEPGIPILPDVLDKNPWLLNCQNGTINLQTGNLQPHRREDYITKLCPTEYQPDAQPIMWSAFLAHIFDGDELLIDFLQRLLGYCLTGHVTEQILPLFYGTGSNGKSTLVGTILDMLGEDFSMKGTSDMLLAKRGNHPTELADLAGKRLVVCIETDEGRRLAEALVKDLTGGDKIRARRMREDFWQFNPTHKLLLVVNHRPIIKGTDHAIWRRIRLVPFTVTIPDRDQDKDLPTKLQAELPAILAWCVRGCLAWQQDGLKAPESVLAATSDYRTQEDVLHAFLAECCQIDPDARIKAGDLLGAYKEWSGEKHTNQRRFGMTLTERGFQRYTSDGTWYRGLTLSTEPTE